MGPLKKTTHHQVGSCADCVDKDGKVVASVLLLLLTTRTTLIFLSRRQNLEQKLFGEGEPGEVLEADNGEDEQQRLVNFRLGDWDPQLLFGSCKHLGDHTLL